MFTAGIARTSLTPYWGVELTGWGYYIQRAWQRIADPLSATALAVSDGDRHAILVALDLMVIDERFTRLAQSLIAGVTGVSSDAILLTCSHSHNAPAAGGLLGVGVCDPAYEDWAARQAATAAILAWQSRQPASFRVAHTEVTDLSFNRTRPEGVIDATLTAARIDRADGSPLAILANFGAHPTVATELQPWAVSRDVPGEVCDHLEDAFPGATAMYIQGACGDVNFNREFATFKKRHVPATRLAAAAKKALADAAPTGNPAVAASRRTAILPTRRWTEAEIRQDRDEAERRLRDNDFSGWREGFGRAMTNRPDDMVKRHGGDEERAVRAMCRFHLEWTDKMLIDFETRPELLETPVHAIRIGNLHIASNASEFFSPFALEIRKQSGVPELMFACYANGRIGYLPDEHDIEARSYAGYQSPKYCDQFPFTPESGPKMCDTMRSAIRDCQHPTGL
ncbi:MAG: hypothetical protein EA381_14755 [Planctomycetaceae bacterium]|nr:MAG: hypothetical protein EA381_14755 [Planctomycetaceae bacterium]